MPDVTGVFQHRRGAEQAIQYVQDMGVAPADIAVISYHADAAPAPHPNPAQGATAGAWAGGLVGSTGGAMAGLGLVAIPGAGPLVASGWLVAAIAGAVVGSTTGGTAGAALGAIMSDGFDNSGEIDSALRNGATLVRVFVPDNQFHAVSDTFQKYAKI